VDPVYTTVLTTPSIRISLGMLWYYMFALCFAVEGGYSIPSVGFTDIHSGVIFALAVSRDLGFVDTGLRGQAGWFQGENEAYGLATYGMRWFFTKNAWRVAPVLDIGIDYVQRSINGYKEQGPAMTYGLGIAINIPSERMRVSPVFFYEGITDIKRQGGFIGMKLGVAYAF
jgi:hypothetical protein